MNWRTAEPRGWRHAARPRPRDPLRGTQSSVAGAASYRWGSVSRAMSESPTSVSAAVVESGATGRTAGKVSEGGGGVWRSPQAMANTTTAAGRPRVSTCLKDNGGKPTMTPISLPPHPGASA
jgi:hypothetical protein